MEKLRKDSLGAHLGDLRSSIIKSLWGLVFGFIVAWFFSERAMEIISLPLKDYLTPTNGNLIFISPFEKFNSYLWLSFFLGLLISSPIWIYQIWSFVAPALYKNEKKSFLGLTLLSLLLFLSGTFFVYFLVLPFSFDFLLGNWGNEVPYISIKSFLSFFLRMSFVFGIVFELPLVLFFLLRFQIVTPKTLKKIRPYVIVIIAVLSALITPPDIFSMLFLMLPLYLMFEGGIFLGKFFIKK